MAIRTKILVVDSDLDTLSKIYLALLHRTYKVEAADRTDDIPERLKRLKPAVIILEALAYIAIGAALKIPAIVLTGKGTPELGPLPGDVIAVEKPVQIDLLVQALERLVV